jgi:alpha-L-fucosidase
MKTYSKTFLPAIAATILAVSCGSTTPPEPYGVTPTPLQIEWQQMEYYMFVHFGPNTFTDVEWGDGRENPRVFNPTALDCRQWVATAKAAGMKGIIVTAKHHDGFCLWPSAYSTHTVRESGWRDGKGDVLRELSDACREGGIELGVYLSPWDRNHPTYGTDEYNKVFADMLQEVLSGYGPVFEQWFDGANGEGPNGKQQVYDWPMFNDIVRRNQPGAAIFSDVGPDCRWVGNERGVAGETNWSTMNIEGFTPGLGAPKSDVLNSGERGGAAWVPAEVDVSIRPGWFYSAATDSQVKSVEQLMDIWYTSVGRNATLLLNVPPDRRGRIHAADSIRLMEFRAAREKAFSENLAAGARVKTDGRRASARLAAALSDDALETFWVAKKNTATLELDLRTPRTFNNLMLGEYIALGQRVTGVEVSILDEASGEWRPVAEATTVGYKRIVRFAEVTARRVRISLEAAAPPVISSVALYNSEY